MLILHLNSPKTMLTENTMRRQVFLIDDDELHSLSVQRMLKKSSYNIKLTVFKDGEKALDYFNNNTEAKNLPDIILLDINMPIVDGWDFLDEFEKIKPTLEKNIDIYMVSSSVDAFDIVRAKTQKIKDYIIKPITINHFYSIFKPEGNITA